MKDYQLSLSHPLPIEYFQPQLRLQIAKNVGTPCQYRVDVPIVVLEW